MATSPNLSSISDSNRNHSRDQKRIKQYTLTENRNIDYSYNGKSKKNSWFGFINVVMSSNLKHVAIVYQKIPEYFYDLEI